MSTACRECGKPLSDPDSEARGIGPICYERIHGSRPPTSRTTTIASVAAPAIKPPPRTAPAEQVLPGFPDLEQQPTLLSRAAEHVIKTQICTAAQLQRHLQVGFATAEQLVAQLEQQGVIGSAANDSARVVLTRRDDLSTTLARIREAGQ